MKRLFSALLALMMLFACAQAEEGATPTPTASANPVGLSIAEYTYAVMSNDTLGVRFSYPSHWEYIPGRRTLCFREPVEEGDIPARMAVSVKQLDDRADSDELTSQLRSLVNSIFTQYDSYEIGNLITDVGFMGKTAHSTFYRAYSGDKVVQGSVIMACVGTKLYAFHFSAEAGDYDAMEQVMEYLRTHVEANNSQ